MRSYYDHLKHIQNNQELTNKKPTFRASAIFPALHKSSISTRYIFLSYWMLKRSINKISCIITLRSKDGNTLYREIQPITEPKAYSIETKDLIIKSGLDVNDSFSGSVEIEFFSITPLIYPFPALTINFYGPHFSSVVHSAQRVYNDYDDMISNSKQHVPEAGFNIYADDKREPYLAIVNGPVKEKSFHLDFTFINKDKETLDYEHILGDLNPYETVFIYPNRELDLSSFLKGAPGTAKVNFNLQWIYPRIIVGNINNQLPAMSLTHSYYDCSDATEATDFWLETDSNHYPASLIVPAVVDSKSFTHITFYPIYTPSSFSIDLEIYDKSGKKKIGLENILTFSKSCGEYISLNINELCQKHHITDPSLGIRLAAKQTGKTTIPSRIKVSIDKGKIQNGIPCNICTNLIPYNPEWESKTKTFRWLPILADQENAYVWIMNNTTEKKPSTVTTLALTFYRTKDTETISREVRLPPCGFTILEIKSDKNLQAFFNGTVGWCSIAATNPYISTYYFTENESGVIGGDHGF
ncbi:MAG: hypothetical protein VX777_07920 [Chlamydiota bacterium]|nr:hypothetical protein [Chlamydiota bacterium]